MFNNKRFQNNDTQEIVMVVGENERFYNLSNGNNIAKNVFLQKYSEMVDVSTFFQQQSRDGLQNLAEKIRTADTSKAIDGDFAPQVKYKQQAVTEQVDAPPEYRDMLLKKFQYEQSHKDLSQYQVYNDDDAAAEDFYKKMQQQTQQHQVKQKPPVMEQLEYQPEIEQPRPVQVNENIQQPVPAYVSPEEESFRVFRSFRKIYPITLSVEFEDKIAQPEFIKLMALNYEGDIIKFYTKEFMNRIYNDPGFLENKIYEKLKEIVFQEKEEPKQKAKPKTTKKPVAKKRTIPKVDKTERAQLQEGK